MNRTIAPAPLDTSWVMHSLHEQKRGLAKLLATEDITVQHDQTDTAYFDVKERILTLPLWESLTLPQYDLLIGHEVGHAKYTPYAGFEALWKEFAATPGLKTYLNVLEDTRIERLMQESFPGLRPAFRTGYADFYRNGPIFKHDTLRPLTSYAFIDRVNLHFKIGAHVADLVVPFSDEERVILAEIAALQTFSETVALARRLYNAAKASGQPQPSQTGQHGPASSASSAQDGPSSGQGTEQDDAAGAPSQDGSGTSQGASESSEQGQGASESNASSDDPSQSSAKSAGTSASAGSVDPQAETDVQAADALRKHAEESRSSSGTRPADACMSSLTAADWAGCGYIVPVDRMQSVWMRSRREVASRSTTPVTTAMEDAVLQMRLQQFDEQQLPTVRLLVQEFTRKQTAKLREKSRTSRTGALNMTKLHAYRFREDLFRTVRTLPKGKNHGILVLIDGSGSMSSYMTDVLEQALFMGEFARAARIPFKAAIFGDTESALLPRGTDYYSTPRVTRATALPTMSQLKIVLDTTASTPWAQQRQLMAHALLMLSTEPGSKASRRYRYYNPTQAIFPDWLAPTDAARRAYQQLQDVRVPGCMLGGTPLVSGVYLAESLLRDFHQTHKVEKSTLMVLTDGAAGDNLSVHYPDGRGGARSFGHRSTGFILRDRQTTKTFIGARQHDRPVGVAPGAPTMARVWESSRHNALGAIYDLMRARYGTRIIGVAIVQVHGRRAQYNVSGMLESMQREPLVPGAPTSSPGPCVETLMGALKTDGCVAVDLPLSLYDLSLFVKSSALVLDTDDFGDLDASKLTPAQVVRAFKKSQTGRRVNRRFVSHMVPYLA